MTKATLTVAAGNRHSVRPTINQDAKDIADGVAAALKQSIRQMDLDAASINDAKIRRSLQGKYPDIVLDDLAGIALDELAAQDKDQVTANSAGRQHAMLTADVQNLPVE